ncbi:hypothetical protein Fot_56427 [Forsythia ovata]|uniref:Uncharacterized protein n=1 Tax=Forsythia ovata TaxID=205694 RepID=A0ABD1NZZ4_9LAMI
MAPKGGEKPICMDLDEVKACIDLSFELEHDQTMPSFFPLSDCHISSHGFFPTIYPSLNLSYNFPNSNADDDTRDGYWDLTEPISDLHGAEDLGGTDILILDRRYGVSKLRPTDPEEWRSSLLVRHPGKSRCGHSLYTLGSYIRRFSSMWTSAFQHFFCCLPAAARI